MRHLAEHGRTQARSTAGTRVAVDTQKDPCALCGGATRVQKSLTRRGVTIAHGEFVAQESVRVCAAHCTHACGALMTYRSQSLSQQVPIGGIYGYDLEVHVGLERFVHQRQRAEIDQQLQSEHAIRLSSGEISVLGQRFLAHLEALHASRTGVLRQALADDGGYPLHIDATGEDGRGTLFVAYAGWRRWVLGAWKLSTERADQILPHLREVVAGFGLPRAIMRELGRAVIAAAAQLVSESGCDIPILSCHTHFLKDVGKDLLADSHDQLRGLFRRFELRAALRGLVRDLGRRLAAKLPTLRAEVAAWAENDPSSVLPVRHAGLATVRALAQWVLDYGQEGGHLGFPFDHPYLDLYTRARMARRAVDAFVRHCGQEDSVRRALERLARILDPVVSEPLFAQTAKIVSARGALFGELRDALRLDPKVESTPLPTPQAPETRAAELHDIRNALATLTLALRQRRPQRGPAEDTRHAIDIVLDHIDRHGASLWGHVIHLPEDIGGGIRVVDRTNNNQEGFWHQMKHAERRRSGRKVLTRDFECLPATAALAYNLTHQDYVTLLCGDLDKLPAAFAELDRASRARLHATPPPDPDLPPRPLSGPLVIELDLEHDPAQASQGEIVSASLPSSDRRLVRASALKKHIQAAAQSRAPRYVPTRATRSSNRVLTL